MPEETNSQNSSSSFKLLLPKIIFVILIFGLGIWVGQNIKIPYLTSGAKNFELVNNNNPENVQIDFAPFWEVWDTLSTEYLLKNELDGQKMLYGAISGLVESAGDPYTIFLTPDKNQEFQQTLNGTYEGVGIALESKDGLLIVGAPIEGSPAEKAGILAGDIILKINDTEAHSLSTSDAANKIKGKKGTEVTLTFQRNDKQFSHKLTRAEITIKSVVFKDLGEGIASIRVSRFGEKTIAEWDEAVGKVLAGGFKKVIIDVRNDPGGLLNDAVTIGGEFVSQGTTIVMREDAKGNKEKSSSERNGRLKDVKVVVLINKGSASASEIVAGALRDLVKAPLVGETSYGKGTIQGVQRYEDGSGLHLTIAKWLTPNGTWVHKNGLKPDHEIKLTENDIKNKKDPQLDKAKELLK